METRFPSNETREEPKISRKVAKILTNNKLEAARTGNWFLENKLIIARLDKLSRNEDVQHKLQVPDCRWDLVVCSAARRLLWSSTFL